MFDIIEYMPSWMFDQDIFRAINGFLALCTGTALVLIFRHIRKLG